MNQSLLQFYVSCAPGIEPILSDECRKLNLREEKSVPATSDRSGEDAGGILLKGTVVEVYRCNLHLRSASRITVRLGSFYAASFAELRKKASRLDWSNFIIPGQGLNIRTTCHKSRLYHSDAVSERVLGAINDHFSRLNPNKNDCKPGKNGQLVLVRLVNDLCTISIDSSGELLHKRGYRLETAKAPLRETLAAAMLLASGWEGNLPLIDPFCGSGTIPIEAALLANQIPPGIARDFAFTRWPGFNATIWQDMLSSARHEIRSTPLHIYGYDRDAGAIRIATANAARVGQKDLIHFSQQTISDLTPPDTTGYIITNPPYGIRVRTGKDLRDLYARLGDVLRTHFGGWHAGILSNDPRLTGNLGLQDLKAELRFINGGIPVSFQIYTL